MPKNRLLSGFVLSISFILILSISVLAATNAIVVDGYFSDWTGQTAHVDSKADDETPNRTDVTEFRAAADSSGQYMLLAWDDTEIKGASSAAGITLRNSSGAYFRIYVVADGKPTTVALSSFEIYSCTDSSCGTQTLVCSGSGCSGAAVGSNNTWVDPFASRSSPDCDGTDCGTKDFAVEMHIPWAYIGGVPGSGQSTFSNYASFPSAAAAAVKDSTGVDGITCINEGSSFNCYNSNPNAVTLVVFAADRDTDIGWLWIAGLAGLMSFGLGRRIRQRRQAQL